MQINFHSIIALALCIAVVSCKKDNYDAPGSKLTGRIVYNGEAINVEYNQVPYQLFQYGFGKVGPVDAGFGGYTGTKSTFAPDGSFAALLFDGDYKFTIPNGQGPFIWKKTAGGNPDTISITLSGSQQLDVEVTPYYMIRTPNLSAAAGKVNGIFKIEKIVTGVDAKDVESVALYINKTQFVSGADNVAFVTATGASITDPNNVTLNVTVPALTPTQNYVYARIGLKIAGVEDRIFSPVVKVQL
jgi:Domain of unknown function (DUF3823_C)/Protein of unknown function (DUF3823) N-terminal domain